MSGLTPADQVQLYELSADSSLLDAVDPAPSAPTLGLDGVTLDLSPQALELMQPGDMPTGVQPPPQPAQDTTDLVPLDGVTGWDDGGFAASGL